MNWISPNTITGNLARGKNYFERGDIQSNIWHEIEKGNYVLFIAPRRVGKSSIVSYMADNPLNGFICKYEDIESDDSIQDFYKRLCRLIKEAVTMQGKSRGWLIEWWNSWTLKKIGTDNIELGKADLDYKEVFDILLSNLKDKNEKVVLFLDEFPDVIWNIYQTKGENEATLLLSYVRTLSHNDEFKNTFVLVLLGSVGLAHIVKKITGRTHKINETHKEYLPALSYDQSLSFIDFLIRDATMKIDSRIKNYLLEKVGYYIPYYIQLLIEECDDLLKAESRPGLTTEDIDQAYNSLMKKNQFFEDWDSRLSKYFPEKINFLNAVLSQCANKNLLSIQEIYDIAIEYNNNLEWKADIDDILIADGYLNEADQEFRFNSPLLKDWWKSRHPILKKS